MRAARELGGLSLPKVAQAVQVSTNAVVQWEHGSLPSDDLRSAVAELYGVDEQTLFAEYEARLAANRALLRPSA
jgi:transcriptional regulator with XRE-family HTH domain